MCRWMIVSVIVASSSVSAAHAQSRGQVIWTASGAGAGFGVGLWAGLSAFDDAVNSDRKVWTSAIVGAGVGAVGGYLIGRMRNDRLHPSITGASGRKIQQKEIDPGVFEQLARSIRFDGSGTFRTAPVNLRNAGRPRRALRLS
jgi:hypothetical protein